MIITDFVKDDVVQETNLKAFNTKVEEFIISSLALEEFARSISNMLEGNAIINITTAQKTAAETKYMAIKAGVLTKLQALD